MPQLFFVLKMTGLISDAVWQIFEPLMVTATQILKPARTAPAWFCFFFLSRRGNQPKGLNRVNVQDLTALAGQD